MVAYTFRFHATDLEALLIFAQFANYAHFPFNIKIYTFFQFKIFIRLFLNSLVFRMFLLLCLFCSYIVFFSFLYLWISIVSLLVCPLILVCVRMRFFCLVQYYFLFQKQYQLHLIRRISDIFLWNELGYIDQIYKQNG